MPTRTAAGRSGHPRIRGVRVLTWHLPGPLSRSVAIRADSRVLLAGGLEPGDHSTDQVLTLDLGHGVVGRRGRLAEPLHDSAGAVLAGRPTVIGGGGATELSDVQRLDAHHQWHVVGHLPGVRSDLSVVSTSAGGFVLGGYDGRSSPTEILRTSDGRQFQAAGALPSGLRYSGVAVADGSVWVLGGEMNGHAVGTHLLVMGGRTSPDTVTSQMWWFTPGAGTWTSAGRLSYPVADAPWVAQGTSALLFGGETPDFTARITRVTWSP
jgi:hypothetical protein